MIPIPEFIQGIESDDYAHDVTHNFNKMMVLYHLVSGIPGLSISSNHTTEKTSFDIIATNRKLANNVNSYINGITFTIYGSKYDINTTSENKKIHVRITKR